MKNLIFVLFLFVMGCSSYFYGTSSTFNHPEDYQWIKTSDGRVIPVKKEDVQKY